MKGASEGTRWELHWDEVAVFDINSASLGVDEFALMTAAGEALAHEVAKASGGKEVLFLCGPGNNGGSGTRSVQSPPPVSVTPLPVAAVAEV